MSCTNNINKVQIEDVSEKFSQDTFKATQMMYSDYINRTDNFNISKSNFAKKYIESYINKSDDLISKEKEIISLVHVMYLNLYDYKNSKNIDDKNEFEQEFLKSKENFEKYIE